MFLLIHFNVLVWLQCGILQPDHMFWVYKPLQTLYASLVDLIWVYFRAKQQLQVLFIPPPLFTAGNPGWSAFINLCYTPDSTLWASLHFTDSWLSCAHLSLYETYWNIFILVICDYLAGMLVFYPAVLTCFLERRRHLVVTSPPAGPSVLNWEPPTRNLLCFTM